MGKPLSLGKKLRYPITVNTLLKQPGDTLNKGDAIFEYTFRWMKEVGDAVDGNTWQEEIKTIASFASAADGKLLRWNIKPGMVIDKDMSCADIDETCSHSVQYAGLCALCGKDMNQTSWATDTVDSERAKINMIHDQTLLAVSQDEASRAEEQLQRRLLKNRKLSLVVDLDQTIIHACIEPTIGEWQQDPNSPNYEAVKDVKSFQLQDDGPRGLASGCWYYIKMRPGLHEFLSHVAEKYELHVYTMGTRAYAQQIANIVDPERKLFGDRIISRDENGSLTAKTLSRLFPVDTKMVVIIDDRADVWPRNRSNLIKVVPYDFFVGIGDINSSFLPKRDEIAKVPIIPVTAATAEAASKLDKMDDGKTADAVSAGKENEPPKLSTTTAEGMSALDELVAMGGGDDPTIRQIQAEEQAHFLEKQLTERPLLHMQQQLEQEDSDDADATANGKDDSAPAVKEVEPHRHHLLKDDDTELAYLEKHLLQLHKTFYDQYDNALIRAKGDRVAHLRPGATKKLPMNNESADLKLVPDIGEVMPRIKANTLQGTCIVLSGLVPLGVDILRSEIGLQASSFGAQVLAKVSRKVTHLVVSANRTRTQKVRQATRYPLIKIVNQQWLADSMSRWEKVDETPYLIDIPREDRSARIEHYDDAQSVEDSSGNDFDSDEDAILDEDDAEGDAPEALQDGKSPIDGLESVNWGDVDAELEEFMASGDDTGDDSDNDSVGSAASDNSQTSTASIRQHKRKHPSTDTEGETDEEGSTLFKKKRLARSRTTGLKTVKTPNSVSESSLPTPERTAAEDDDVAGDTLEATTDENPSFDDDLEAEMLAEFEKDGWDDPDDAGENGHGG